MKGLVTSMVLLALTGPVAASQLLLTGGPHCGANQFFGIGGCTDDGGIWAIPNVAIPIHTEMTVTSMRCTFAGDSTCVLWFRMWKNHGLANLDCYAGYTEGLGACDSFGAPVTFEPGDLLSIATSDVQGNCADNSLYVTCLLQGTP